ncbi:hypothetical protein pEaSNUABM49_00432 [Erwinia phage pEa_SNUABM_49]|nr:hypothetical protein pEaSNUABM49_00432 [Erwinia phage pEa_SNUABM_49]
MKKIFVVPNGESYFGVSMVALTEDGDCIAGHLSSNTTWGRHDMGIGSDWKHDLYDKEYGAGQWELLYADDEVMDSEEFKLAVQRNHEKGEADEQEETEDEETE